MTVYIGIDWSKSQHDIAMMNEQGALLAHLTIKDDFDGFAQLHEVLEDWQKRSHEAYLALESAHLILIDQLWDWGFHQVYVVPPNVVTSARGRYRQSKAKDDRHDAMILADLLRTDRHRLYPWRPDSLPTRQIRAEAMLYQQLVRESTRQSNRLTALLQRYYPVALDVFSDLKTQIALAFIQAYPTPEAAQALDFQTFRRFCRQQGYPKPDLLPRCFARLQRRYPPASADTVQMYQREAVVQARLLAQTLQEQRQTLRTLQQHFQQHPDAFIFDSLPGAGEYLAPALLAKFGDRRDRFPSAAVVQALAGTCPVTIRSGRSKRIRFRKACDKHFRYIVQQFARCSLNKSVWANAYYEQARSRGHSLQHARRCLANRWLSIIWKLWQTRQPYDEAYHLRQRERFASHIVLPN